MLVNELWCSSHSWKVIGGHRRNSDHTPVTLFSENINYGPKPFRSFDDWLKMKAVQDAIDKVVEESMQ